MFQNLQLRDVSLSVQVTEPFKTMVDYKGVQPIGGGEIRTLVLSDHPTHDYMLIASYIEVIMLGGAPRLTTGPVCVSVSSTHRRDRGPHRDV